MLKSNENLRVEEIRVPDDLASRRLDQFGAASRDFLFVAVRELGAWQFNPPPEFMVKPGHVLVIIATPHGRKALEQRIAAMA
jgi:voltage-gated potassium channel